VRKSIDPGQSNIPSQNSRRREYEGPQSPLLQFHEDGRDDCRLGRADAESHNRLSPGTQRSAILRKARQNETAAHLSEWLMLPSK
jgi:hypothetical protein